MPYMISIDFGSAYTKVGVRHNLNKPSQLITEQSLVNDPNRFCIPTLAAVADRLGKTRWVYGPEATKVVEGNGIRVYRNWKSQLFTPPQRNKPATVIAHASAVTAARPSSLSPHTAAHGSGHTDPDIKAITAGYFTWLRKFLAAPCERLGVRDLGKVPVRICVPAFGMNGHSAKDFSPSEELLVEILTEAGWNCDYERPIITEPESNAIGVYTHGKNAIWTPDGKWGKEYIHFRRMIECGGYLAALRQKLLCRNESERHRVLVIDIGAFTTDVALVAFNLRDYRRPPEIICQSEPLGIHELDQNVLRRLPEHKSASVLRLDTRRREELKQSLYVDEAPYRLENTTIGTDSEGETVKECLRDFTNRIREFLDRFLGEKGVKQLNEVILTGGGNLIPRLASGVTKFIVGKKLNTTLVHSPMKGSPAPSKYYNNYLDSRAVRGSSGIGGASIYFENRFW